MPGTSASFSVCSLVVERVKTKLGGDSLKVKAYLCDSGFTEVFLAFLGMIDAVWPVQFLRFCGAIFLCLLEGAEDSKGPQPWIKDSDTGKRSQHPL